MANPNYRFGTVATLLEMIPVASLFFMFTNTGEDIPLSYPVTQPRLTAVTTVGAALWAADIEQKNSDLNASTAPNLREAAKKAE